MALGRKQPQLYSANRQVWPSDAAYRPPDSRDPITKRRSPGSGGGARSCASLSAGRSDAGAFQLFGRSASTTRRSASVPQASIGRRPPSFGWALLRKSCDRAGSRNAVLVVEVSRLRKSSTSSAATTRCLRAVSARPICAKPFQYRSSLSLAHSRMGWPSTILPSSHACQTAFKRDPRSASKRDPLFG